MKLIAINCPRDKEMESRPPRPVGVYGTVSRNGVWFWIGLVGDRSLSVNLTTDCQHNGDGDGTIN